MTRLHTLALLLVLMALPGPAAAGARRHVKGDATKATHDVRPEPNAHDDEPVPEPVPEPPLDEAPYADAKAKAEHRTTTRTPPARRTTTQMPPAREPDAGVEAEAAGAARERRPQAYFFRVSSELTLRHFGDTEATRGAPRIYQAFPVPGVAVFAEAYPLFGVLGLGGSLGHSFGAESTTSDRRTVGTTYLRADGALKGRLTFGRAPTAPFIAAFVGYLYSSFTFDSAPPERETPTGSYQALRFGLDARIPFRRVVFLAGAEYDHLLVIGGLGVTKAHAPGNGVTGNAGFGFQIVPWLVARVDARLSWFRYGLVRDVTAHAEDFYVTFGGGFEVAF